MRLQVSFATFQAGAVWTPTTKDRRNTETAHANQQSKPGKQQTAYSGAQIHLGKNGRDGIAESLPYRTSIWTPAMSWNCPKVPQHQVLWLAGAALLVDDLKHYTAHVKKRKKKNLFSCIFKSSFACISTVKDKPCCEDLKAREGCHPQGRVSPVSRRWEREIRGEFYKLEEPREGLPRDLQSFPHKLFLLHSL